MIIILFKDLSFSLYDHISHSIFKYFWLEFLPSIFFILDLSIILEVTFKLVEENFIICFFLIHLRILSNLSFIAFHFNHHFI